MNILNKEFNITNEKITLDFRMHFFLICYLILGIVLFNYYQYQINADGITYINIAKSYISGNFYGSISDYWSPLFSWLLMPFLSFLQTPLGGLQAAKILSLILGFFTMIGVRQLSYKFEMDEIVRTIILLIMIPVILYFVMSVITPDLLMVCLLVFYLAIIYDIDYYNNSLNAVLCGIFGALAYLSKSYAFTFFIITFFVFNVLQYLRDSNRNRRKKIIKSFFLGFTIFLIISGIWIGLISNKDQKLTIGTSGELNYAKVGPHYGVSYAPGIQGAENGITNFEPAMPKSWSPFSSWSNFKHQLKVIWKNTIDIGTFLNSFSCIYLLITLFSILICIKAPRNILSQNIVLLYSLLAILICAGGYAFILVEERYLWLIYILLILMGGYLLNLIFNANILAKNKFRNLLKTVILLVFMASFVFMPVNYLFQNMYTINEFYDLSVNLNSYGVEGNIAATNDQYARMEFLRYFMGFNYYGQPQTNISALELQKELKNYRIDYYFVWFDSNQSTYMNSYNEVTHGNIPDLKVYSIK